MDSYSYLNFFVIPSIQSYRLYSTEWAEHTTAVYAYKHSLINTSPFWVYKNYMKNIAS